jgi:hypothetical protein
MNISISSNISPYQSLAKYMQSISAVRKDMYSSEIDGIFDAPDNTNSEKEWEYFCANAERFTNTMNIIDNSFQRGIWDFADVDAQLGLYNLLVSLAASCDDPAKKEGYIQHVSGLISRFQNRFGANSEKKGELLLALMPLFEMNLSYNAMSRLTFFLPPLYMDKTVKDQIRDNFIEKMAYAVDPEKRKLISSVQIFRSDGEEIVTIKYRNGTIFMVRELDQIWKANNSILDVMRILPAGFFKGLRSIKLYSKIFQENEGGHYSRKDGICLNLSDSIAGIYKNRTDLTQIIGYESTLIHELAHHWDESNFAGDIYHNISWKNRLFFWEKRGDDLRDFLNGYGETNELEDLAAFTEGYVTTPAALRLFVRQQIHQTNFEPAVKYLFVRYVMPFKGMEYEVSDSSPSFGFEELRLRLELFLKGHGNSIAPSTLRALEQIEEVINDKDNCR